MNDNAINIAKIKSAAINKGPVSGVITGFNDYGWLVDVYGYTAFLPSNQFIKDNKAQPESYLGKEYLLRVDEFQYIPSNGKPRITSFKVSYFKQQFDGTDVGDLVVGYVKYFTKKGVALQVRDFTAWLSIDEIPNWQRENIFKYYSRGKQVEAEILNISFKTGHIEVSVRALVERKTRFFEELEVNSIYETTVCRTERNEVIVDINGFEGIIRIGDIANEFIVDINDYVSVGSKISCMLLSKDINKNKLYFGIRQVQELRERERKENVKKIASGFEVGEVFEAIVKNITANGVEIILGGDIAGFIPKEEIRWGFSDFRTETFVGEKRNVVFLREEDGLLICSTKLLEKDNYNPELYNLDTDSLLATLGINNNSFVGKAIQGNYGVMMLVNLYADSKDDDGKLLVDPISGAPINIIIPAQVHNIFKKDSYYKLSLRLFDTDRRREERTPYRFYITNQDALNISKNIIEDPYKRIVERSFFKHKSPSSNANQANLLEEVGQNMYDSKDRMFFELLQNADDASSKNGVNVILQSVDDFIIMAHNGMPFDRRDYVSITSAARSNKGDKKEKTGYKGIGFKSVFTNSTKVFIKTGGFFFKFDKSAPIFSDFEGFYFTVNELTDELKQQEYLADNREEKEEFRGVDSIPWQLLPFWEDAIPTKLRRTVFGHNQNVAIALRMTELNQSEYTQAILSVLEDPKFMLFLRNTKRIEFRNGNYVFNLSKKLLNGKTVLQSTRPGRELINNFHVEVGTIVKIDNDAFLSVGVDIKIIHEKNKNTGKEENKFVNSTGQKIPSIPSRISDSSATQLSYAFSLDSNNKYMPIKARHSMYAYLPMVETRFPFPIYINADFILKSNRQGIQNDNVWNHFLMYHIGRNYVSWIANAASKQQPYYLSLLLNAYYDISDKDMAELATFFNKGYKEALEIDGFILNDKEQIVKQTEIAIDLTEISKIIGGDLFCELVGLRDRRLPHPNLDCSILESPIFTGILHVNSVNEYLKSKDIKYIRNWISSADETQKVKTYEWIKKHGDEDLIMQLPIFSFNGKFRSISEIDGATQFLFLDSSLIGIKDILEKIGFVCSDNAIQSHALYESSLKDKILKGVLSQSISTIISRSQSNEDKLTAEDKIILYQTISSKCSSDKLKTALNTWKLFKNSDNQPCQLSVMMPSGNNTYENRLFSSYIICESDYQLMPDEVRKMLMSRDKIYTSYIVSNWNALIDKWEKSGKELNWNESDYAMIYGIVHNHYTAYCSNNPSEKVKTISLFSGSQYILCNDTFKTRDEVFYSSSLSASPLRNAALKMLDIHIPSVSALPYLAKEPFVTVTKNWTTQKCNESILLEEEEVKAVLNFCKNNKEDFFEKYNVTAKDSLYDISIKGSKWQFLTDNTELASFVLTNLENSVWLPIAFNSFNSDENLIQGDDLYDRIFANVDLIEHGSTLLKIVNSQSDKVKKKYLSSLGEVVLNNSSFNEDSFYTNLLRLCDSLFLCANDHNAENIENTYVQSLRDKIVIEYTDINEIKLSKRLNEIPLQGKVTVGKYTFDMDDINPSGLQSFQKAARGVLSAMRAIGLKEDFLSELFELTATIKASDVFATLNSQISLVSGAQLAFMIRYVQSNNAATINFRVEAKDKKIYNCASFKEWYINDFSFISSSRILDVKYYDLDQYIQSSEYEDLNKYFILLNNADSFKYVKSSLTDEEKKDILNYLYEKWASDSSCWASHRSIDNLLLVLGIDRDTVIISDKYALLSETLPISINDWINLEDDTNERKLRVDFLVQVFSLNDDASDIVQIRKYISGDGIYEAKAKATNHIQDKTRDWIICNKIKFTESQYTNLKVMFDSNHVKDTVNLTVINKNIDSNIPSLVVNDYSIYEYEGIIPRHACFVDQEPYFVYEYEEGDFCLDGNKIIVSTNSWGSLDNILMTIASDNNSGFSSADFLTYMQMRETNAVNHIAESDLQAQLEAANNELRRLREALNNMNVDMTSFEESYTGLDRERQEDALSEARRAVIQHLRNEGFYVPDNDCSDWTKIEGVKKAGEEYTVIVRSYRDTESRNFELNPSEWINLMNGNSMLWIYTPRGPECFPFKDLVKNKSRISLSFSTINTDYKMRMNALAEILRYFKGIRFDFGPNISYGHSTAERFIKPEQKLNEILSADSEEGMF